MATETKPSATSAEIKLTPESIQSITAPQDLQRIHQALSQEMSILQTSAMKLKEAQDRFALATNALDNLLDQFPKILSKKEVYDEKMLEMMIPVTASLYYKGRLMPRDNVRVDIGTGVYLDKSLDNAKTYYTGKIEMLGEQGKLLEARAKQLIPVIQSVEARAAELTPQAKQQEKEHEQ